MPRQNRSSGSKRRRKEPTHNRIEEAEWKQHRSIVKRYRWKNWAVITGVYLSFFLLVVFILFCDIPPTAINVVVGLAVLNGAVWLLLRIMCRPAYNLSIQIPLKNDGCWLWRGGELCCKEVTHDDSTCPIPPEYLTRIDDRQIIIDSDSTGARIFMFLLCSSLLYYTFIQVYFSDSIAPAQSFAEELLFAEMGVMLTSIIAYVLLNPRKRIVFDRTAKTVTIPGTLLMNKTETIPYDQAELSYHHHMRSKVDEVVIYNPSGRPLGVSVMPGRTDEALRLARFIHSYMEDEELPNIPELEKYRNEGKQTQSSSY